MSTESHFGDRLAQAVREKRSAVCVGLDPRLDQLPEPIRQSVNPEQLESVAQATEQYCRCVIDAVADIVPIVKPQAAFFELLGPPGMACLERVILHARNRGLLVLLDAKRGDIGSTADGYARAYLGAASPWRCDALTVNPYLGEDTLKPFVDTANQQGAGVFVLVKTSNPGSGFIQDVPVDDEWIYSRVAHSVQRGSASSLGDSGFGNVGAVVGATYPQQLSELRRLLPNVWLLIPGFGAQGGGPDDVAPGFRPDGLGAIVNSSRGIIFAYEQPRFQNLDWQQAIAMAAKEMTDQLPQVG